MFNRCNSFKPINLGYLFWNNWYFSQIGNFIEIYLKSKAVFSSKQNPYDKSSIDSIITSYQVNFL